MTQKKGNAFKKSIISLFLVVCSLASIAVVSANAESSSSRAQLSNGYVVTTTASRTTYTASGKAAITSGAPSSIKLVTKGYFGSTTNSYTYTQTKQSGEASSVKVPKFKYYDGSGNAKKTYKVKSTGTYKGETMPSATA